jgi:hypothetical protein
LAFLAATRLLLVSSPLLLTLFFFLHAAMLLGASGLFCAPAFFCLRGFAPSTLFRLGLRALLGQLLLGPASLLLRFAPLSLALLRFLVAAPLLGPSGFFCAPALVRFRGFAPSPFLRLGPCAFLGQLLFSTTRFSFLTQPLLFA